MLRLQRLNSQCSQSNYRSEIVPDNLSRKKVFPTFYLINFFTIFSWSKMRGSCRFPPLGGGICNHYTFSGDEPQWNDCQEFRYGWSHYGSQLLQFQSKMLSGVRVFNQQTREIRSVPWKTYIANTTLQSINALWCDEQYVSVCRRNRLTTDSIAR